MVWARHFVWEQQFPIMGTSKWKVGLCKGQSSCVKLSPFFSDVVIPKQKQKHNKNNKLHKHFSLFTNQCLKPDNLEGLWSIHFKAPFKTERFRWKTVSDGTNWFLVVTVYMVNIEEASPALAVPSHHNNLYSRLEYFKNMHISFCDYSLTVNRKNHIFHLYICMCICTFTLLIADVMTLSKCQNTICPVPNWTNWTYTNMCKMHRRFYWFYETPTKERLHWGKTKFLESCVMSLRCLNHLEVQAFLSNFTNLMSIDKRNNAVERNKFGIQENQNKILFDTNLTVGGLKELNTIHGKLTSK